MKESAAILVISSGIVTVVNPVEANALVGIAVTCTVASNVCVCQAAQPWNALFAIVVYELGIATALLLGVIVHTVIVISTLLAP